ncbi:MAG: hypothetical protein WC130_11680 [Kiritimatiellia bacterium]
MNASKEERIIDAKFEVIRGPDTVPEPENFKQKVQSGVGWFKYVIWALWALAGLAMLAGEALPALAR